MATPGAWKRWALPASLALNVFLGILVALHPPFHGRGGPPGPPDARLLASRIAETLPPEDGAILMEEFARNEPQFRRSREIQHDEAPGRIRAALAASDFNPDALKAALDVNRAGRQLIDDALSTTLVAAASRMSPEGRARLSRWEPPRPPGPPPGQ